MIRPGVCALFLAFSNSAQSTAIFKLYLAKTGTDQLVREYKMEGDRLSFYSVEREDWEQVPLAIVDLGKTKSVIKARADEVRADAAAQAAEDKAEREARRECEAYLRNRVFI